jgi:hypothetical protein
VAVPAAFQGTIAATTAIGLRRTVTVLANTPGRTCSASCRRVRSANEAASVLRREAMNKQISWYEMATSIIKADRFL